MVVQAFNLFSIIIDRLQADVAPFAPAILQLLPEVWADADGQPLMRSQVCACDPHCSLLVVHTACQLVTENNNLRSIRHSLAKHHAARLTVATLIHGHLSLSGVPEHE